MANNHKQEGVNIYAKEFKDKLKNLVMNGTFQRDILFNGYKKDYDLLTQEEQEALSRKFKAFVNENIISSMSEEVEFILDCEIGLENRYINKPFSREDIENEYIFNYERAIEDILNAFESVPYNSIDYDILYKDIDEDDQESINDFLEIVGIEDENLNECSFGFLYDKIKDKLEEMDEDEVKELVQDNYNILGLDESEYEEYQEVYQWFLVSSWLVELLNEAGEVVITSYNYWGRSCYGQSIELDGVMHDIFLNLWCG